MKTLLYISYGYPPQQGIVSLRASRMIHHLQDLGYRCLVLSGTVLHDSRNDLSVPDPAWKTLKVDFADPDRLFAPLRRWLVRRSAGTGSTGSDAPDSPGWVKQFKMNLLPLNFSRMPNRHVPWIPPAVLAVLKSGIKPDALFTSSPPPASALLGAFFKRLWGIPWIAEFRDLWSHNPIERLWPPLSRMDEKLERLVLSGADRLATVSDELADVLVGLHGKPTMLLPNGHDWDEPPPWSHAPRMNDPIHILHGGNLYRGRRDPSLLFSAIRTLRDEGTTVNATFLGEDSVEVAGFLSGRFGISEHVTCLPRIPHDRYIEMVGRADALVVLEGTGPDAAGNATGKLFEYVGSRKPVLAVAARGGAIDRLLRRTGQGRAVSTASDMEEQLRLVASRMDLAIDEGEVRSLSRRRIAEKLARALDELLDGR